MEKSTIIGISVLAVAGTAFYFYSKGKKSTTTNSTVTTPTPPTNDIKALADLGVKIEEPKVTPYVAQSVPIPTVSLENIQKALLSLGIDQTRGISELSSPNYIEAKKIAENIKILSKIRVGTITGKGNIPSTTPTIVYSHSSSVYFSPIDVETLSDLYGSSVKGRCAGWQNSTCSLSMSIQDMVNNMTKKINSLGYKLLPNFDIEKM